MPELEGLPASAGPSDGASGPRRARGVTAAILALLADGRTRSPVEISAELAAKGVGAKSVGVALSVLARQGKVARPSRGVYAKAGDK